MKKPQWFRLIDFLALSVCVLLATAVLIYVLTRGIQSQNATQGAVLLATVDVCFILFWIIRARDRKQWLDTFRWIPEYGFMVQANGYLLPADQEVNAHIRDIVNSWVPFHPNAEAIIKSEVNWVYFRKDMNEMAIEPGQKKVNGFTVAGTHVIHVSFNDKLNTIQKTALGHELGHVIHGVATNSWNQDEHHQFMREHGLT